jgi:sialic acid synthase SpsE
MKRYKLASREAFETHSREDYDVFSELLLSEGKEVFATGRTHSWRKNIKPIFGVPSYPTYPDEVKIPLNFNSTALTTCWYGYSSHVHGFSDALIAIARGAQYIEKHVTLNKLEDSIKDHGFALSFDEFGEMVRIGRNMDRLCSIS